MGGLRHPQDLPLQQPPVQQLLVLPLPLALPIHHPQGASLLVPVLVPVTVLGMTLQTVAFPTPLVWAVPVLVPVPVLVLVTVLGMTLQTVAFPTLLVWAVLVPVLAPVPVTVLGMTLQTVAFPTLLVWAVPTSNCIDPTKTNA